MNELKKMEKDNEIISNNLLSEKKKKIDFSWILLGDSLGRKIGLSKKEKNIGNKKTQVCMHWVFNFP